MTGAGSVNTEAMPEHPSIAAPMRRVATAYRDWRRTLPPAVHLVGLQLGLSAVFMSLLANLRAGPVLGAVQGHFWKLVAIVIGWIITIGLAVNGVSYFCGTVPSRPRKVPRARR